MTHLHTTPAQGTALPGSSDGSAVDATSETPGASQALGASQGPRLTIDIWSDIACPWCYIGKRKLEAALDAFPHRESVDVVWRSFQLVPELPALFDGSEGQYLQQVRGISSAQVNAMFAQTIAAARTVDLDYDFDRVIVANSLPAHQLLHLARRYGVADAVKDDLLAARFLTGENTGDPEVLARIGQAHGIPEAEVTEELRTGALIPAVQSDIAEAQRLGIRGVPHFRFSDSVQLSGAQPVAVFTTALERAWAEVELAAAAAAETAETAGVVCTPDGCVID